MDEAEDLSVSWDGRTIGGPTNPSRRSACGLRCKTPRSVAALKNAKAPFGGPEQVLRYLGRYTHRVAISNHRLLAFDGKTVTFRWRDYAHGNVQRVMPLAAGKFIRRVLLHVLPKGFVRIRHFGFMANSQRACRVSSRDHINRHFRTFSITTASAADHHRLPSSLVIARALKISAQFRFGASALPMNASDFWRGNLSFRFCDFCQLKENPLKAPAFSQAIDRRSGCKFARSLRPI